MYPSCVRHCYGKLRDGPCLSLSSGVLRLYYTAQFLIAVCEALRILTDNCYFQKYLQYYSPPASAVQLRRLKIISRNYGTLTIKNV